LHYFIIVKFKKQGMITYRARRENTIFLAFITMVFAFMETYVLNQE